MVEEREDLTGVIAGANIEAALRVSELIQQQPQSSRMYFKLQVFQVGVSEEFLPLSALLSWCIMV